MKYIHLMVLVFLTACGGDPDENTAERSLEEQEGLSRLSLRPAVRMISNSRGHQYTFKYDDLARDYLVVKERIDLDEEAIILRVSGDDYYAYLVQTDKVTNKIRKRVVLRRYDFDAVSEALRQSGSENNGGILSYRKETSVSASGNRKIFKRKYVSENVLNLRNAVCEYSIKDSDVEVQFVSNGTMKTLKNLERSTISTCGHTATIEEISGLDLSSVEFCDLDQKCDARTDMSWLKTVQ